jgi:hypothetical protein
MGTESPQRAWNYFNYFTEIEEHFQRARGTGLFLMSPLDWALVESWKNCGIPLEAVLRGIDSAFEKRHKRRLQARSVNSVAYCAQAVDEEARAISRAGQDQPQPRSNQAFELDDVRSHLQRCSKELEGRSAYTEIAEALKHAAGNVEQHYSDLEDLEQRLTALEEKMTAIARAGQSEEQLLAARKELDSSLRPYRSRMTAGQLAMIERQYLERMILERESLPRLSLFYLR